MKRCFKGQNWYLYAYCTIRCDYRFFKLRRIKNLELFEEYFERRPPMQIFSEETMFQDEAVTITLKRSKDMAYRVYDEFSEFKVLPDGSFQARVTMPRGKWVFYYLATFGEHCEVVEPEDIRKQVRDQLQKTLAQYL